LEAAEEEEGEELAPQKLMLAMLIREADSAGQQQVPLSSRLPTVASRGVAASPSYAIKRSTSMLVRTRATHGL
jgi:hypothetical protein